MSKVIGYMPSNIPRILINRTIVHPKTSSKAAQRRETSHDSCDDDSEDDIDFRDGYMFDACLLGFCDDVSTARILLAVYAFCNR